MDSLVEMPPARWAEVRDSFKRHWPHGVPGYYALNTQILHPTLSAAYDVKVFTPNGVIDDGVVIFNNKGGTQNEVIVLTNNKNTKQLEEALANTKRVDWTKQLCVPWAEADVVDLMKEVSARIGLKKIAEGPTLKHFLSKETKLFDNVECLPDTYTGSLETKHINQVNSVWPHRYATSPRLFELLIQNNLSYGLFSKTDNSLLAWLFFCEVGFLTHLYCEEAHRRKGYAEFIAKYAINDQLKKGNDVFCYIIVLTDEGIAEALNNSKFEFSKADSDEYPVFVPPKHNQGPNDHQTSESSSSDEEENALVPSAASPAFV